MQSPVFVDTKVPLNFRFMERWPPVKNRELTYHLSQFRCQFFIANRFLSNYSRLNAITDSQSREFLEVCRNAARIGGDQLLKFRDGFQTHKKKGSDFVTDADLASQTAIFDFLMNRYPDHGFLGEEDIDSQNQPTASSPYCWIVDPLDGTLNYIHQLQSYSVSVALRKGNDIVAGAVFDPVLDEMFAASNVSPATLNDQSIEVSGCDLLADALVVVSLPSQVSSNSPELDSFLRLLYHARSIRRLGSAALNLCYIAAGRLDAYWATTVNLWDIAAGWLILTRAGGTMRDLSGGPLDPGRPRFAASASQDLTQQIEQLLK